MTTPDSNLRDASAAMQEGRFDDALPLISGVFGQIASGDPQAVPLYPVTMFLWGQLAAQSEAARATLAQLRGYHADLLMGGDAMFMELGDAAQLSRFALIVQMDQALNYKRSTYKLFTLLMQAQPVLASREAFLALPAIVDAGDFALAERILGNPLDALEELNGLSVLYPLVPAPDQPPRLAAELSNFIRNVLMRATVLRGLGRGAEADAVVNKAKNGIVAKDMRALAEREFAAPGTIMQELAAMRERHHAQSSLS